MKKYIGAVVTLTFCILSAGCGGMLATQSEEPKSGVVMNVWIAPEYADATLAKNDYYVAVYVNGEPDHSKIAME